MSNGLGGTTPETHSLPAEIHEQVLETGASALDGLIDPSLQREAASRVLDALGSTISVRQTEITATQHVGPIPSPQTVANYNEILPGSADRLFKMAEKDQDAFIRSTSRKQWLDFAFKSGCVVLGIVGLAGILGTAIYLAQHGQKEVAIAVVTAMGIGVVTAIVNARPGRSDPSKPPAESE